MKPIHYVYTFLIFVMVLPGCTTTTSPIPSVQTETQPPSPTPVLPTTTFTPAPRPTQTLTLTPPATLEPEQARDAIKTLLREPIDCDAPCFWGIVPGQTTLGEAKNVFTRLGLQVASTAYEGKDFYGIDSDFDDGLSIGTTLTVSLTDKVVENLRVDILPEKQKTGIPREWQAYSPETLINRYGPPSRVGFALDWGPRSFFDMVMYFDSVDLIVEYTGYDIIPRQKGSSQVCPLTAQFDSVRIWMGKDPVYPPYEGIPLENVTSMTIEEFSELMMGDHNKACFVVNGNVFP